MTTIIARNRELVADRRKVVNYRKAGVVGIRDEPKIYKTPFCLYGISGFEMGEALEDFGMPKLLMMRRLATLFALSYLVEGGDEVEKELLKLPGATDRLVTDLIDNLKSIRNICGVQVAKELDQVEMGIVAMGPFTTLHMASGEFLAMKNIDTVVLGSGVKMTSILLDHNLSYDEIYPALRRSGMPSGEKYDLLSVEHDLPKAYPPISDPQIMRMVARLWRKSELTELKAKTLTPEQMHTARGALAETLATLLSLGRITKRNRWVWSKKPIFSWKEPEKRKHIFFTTACKAVGVKEDEQQGDKQS